MAVKTERFIGLGQTLLHCKALTIIFKIGYGKTISHDSQISPNCEFFPSWAHCGEAAQWSLQSGARGFWGGR